jgi:hypothetical protein
MNRKAYMSSILGAVLLLGAGITRAQGPQPGHDGPPPPGGPMELMGFEGLHHGQVVKGAPFSASVSTETTHTLQDGTVIHRSSQGSIARDSQGRSRREMTFSGFGPLAASGGTRTRVSILDPVNGTHFMLDPASKTARKMSFQDHGPKNAANAEGRLEKKQEKRAQEEAAGTLKTESLGTQVINGVSAEGTRVTHTIPAGQIGNDKPIVSTSERWYSPDLQVVVKSTRTDPQFGTTTYSLTNIQKGEPASSLFTVPSDYAVTQGGHGRHGGPGPGAPPPPEEQ